MDFLIKYNTIVFLESYMQLEVSRQTEADVRSDVQSSIIAKFSADQMNKEKLHLTEAAVCLEVRWTSTPRTLKLLGYIEGSAR